VTPLSPPGASDPDAGYYQTIEEFFVSRRRDCLMLSNSDWTLIREWRRAGIPLRVVLRGIQDALEAHAHSWSRKQKIGSLRYCAAEVEAARDKWGRSLGEGDTLPGALERFAEALGAAHDLGPRAGSLVPALAEAMRERALLPESSRELETWLQAREEELLAALAADYGSEESLAFSIEAALERYKGRLPDKVLDQVRRDGRARRLLEAKGLPRLSLFHL
jgi:hypothetical protein